MPIQDCMVSGMWVYKEGGDPSSLYHVYIYVLVCVLELWEVSWQRTWAGQSSLDLSELTGTMKTSGVFSAPLPGSFQLFLRWVFFFFLKVKIQYLHWTGNDKCICPPYFKILNNFNTKDQFWEIIIMTAIMKMVMGNNENNFHLLSIHYILGRYSGLLCIICNTHNKVFIDTFRIWENCSTKQLRKF